MKLSLQYRRFLLFFAVWFGLSPALIPEASARPSVTSQSDLSPKVINAGHIASGSATANQTLLADGSGGAAWGSITSTTFSGVLSFAHGGTNNSAGYASMAVPFSDGTKLTSDVTDFSWDTSTNALSVAGNVNIGTNAANNARLTIFGTGQVAASPSILLRNTSDDTSGKRNRLTFEDRGNGGYHRLIFSAPTDNPDSTAWVGYQSNYDLGLTGIDFTTLTDDSSFLGWRWGYWSQTAAAYKSAATLTRTGSLQLSAGTFGTPDSKLQVVGDDTSGSTNNTSLEDVSGNPLFQLKNSGIAFLKGPVGIGSGAGTARQTLSLGSTLDLYSGSSNTPTVPSVRGTTTQLVLNGFGAGGVQFDLDAGTGGVSFGNGAGSVVASVDSSGNGALASATLSNATASTLAAFDGSKKVISATVTSPLGFSGGTLTLDGSDIVHKSGTETISGAKTFSSSATFSGGMTTSAFTLSNKNNFNISDVAITAGYLHVNGSGVVSYLANVAASDLAGQVAVANGGTGFASATSNGVILGNGTGAMAVTAAGTADQLLRIPGAGGAPAFGSLDLSKAAAVGTSVLGAANGGTGQSSLTAGSLVIGNGTSGATLVGNGGAGTVLTGTGSTNPAYSATPTLTNLTLTGTGSSLSTAPSIQLTNTSDDGLSKLDRVSFRTRGNGGYLEYIESGPVDNGNSGNFTGYRSHYAVEYTSIGFSATTTDTHHLGDRWGYWDGSAYQHTATLTRAGALRLGGSFATPGAQLEVIGSGATSATTSFSLKDSGGNPEVTVKDDKSVTLAGLSGSGSNYIGVDNAGKLQTMTDPLTSFTETDPLSLHLSASGLTANKYLGTDGSGNVVVKTDPLTGTVGVVNGGTGLTSLATGALPYGNGTSAMNALAQPATTADQDHSVLHAGSGAPSWTVSPEVCNLILSGLTQPQVTFDSDSGIAGDYNLLSDGATFLLTHKIGVSTFETLLQADGSNFTVNKLLEAAGGMKISFSTVTSPTLSAGGGTALPATPTGFIPMSIGGSTHYVPYY